MARKSGGKLSAGEIIALRDYGSQGIKLVGGVNP